MNKNSLVVGIWEEYIKMYNVGVQALKIYYSLEGELKETEEEEREVVLIACLCTIVLNICLPFVREKVGNTFNLCGMPLEELQILHVV